uniref:Uncharacterized protein n=1 Tax=Arundo donax TaxID=35708 RepID=A0A0A9H7M4_ARUDO
MQQTSSMTHSNYNVTAQHNKASFVYRYIAHMGSSTEVAGSSIRYFQR